VLDGDEHRRIVTATSRENLMARLSSVEVPWW
jgi:hypothetical protein